MLNQIKNGSGRLKTKNVVKAYRANYHCTLRYITRKNVLMKQASVFITINSISAILTAYIVHVTA